MRKLFIEGLVIFVSILASLSVDNMRETNEEKEILNEAVITLGDEINSNINYTKEHIKQVKNMYYLTAQVVDNYDEIRLKDVFKIHSENPYIHSIIENGKIEYKKQYSNEDYRVFVWTNAWDPEKVLFQSKLYFAEILEKKNKDLGKKLNQFTQAEES